MEVDRELEEYRPTLMPAGWIAQNWQLPPRLILASVMVHIDEWEGRESDDTVWFGCLLSAVKRNRASNTWDLWLWRWRCTV